MGSDVSVCALRMGAITIVIMTKTKIMNTALLEVITRTKTSDVPSHALTLNLEISGLVRLTLTVIGTSAAQSNVLIQRNITPTKEKNVLESVIQWMMGSIIVIPLWVVGTTVRVIGIRCI